MSECVPVVGVYCMVCSVWCVLHGVYCMLVFVWGNS